MALDVIVRAKNPPVYKDKNYSIEISTVEAYTWWLDYFKNMCKTYRIAREFVVNNNIDTGAFWDEIYDALEKASYSDHALVMKNVIAKWKHRKNNDRYRRKKGGL